MHETMLGLGIILDDGRRATADQRVPERAIGLGARHMIDARLADMHRAGNARRELERILALIGPHRVIDRWISGDTSLDPPILRGADEGTAAAKTEADDAEGRAAVLQMVE